MFSKNISENTLTKVLTFFTFHMKGFVNRMMKIAKSHKDAPFPSLSAQCQISKYSKTNFS